MACSISGSSTGLRARALPTSCDSPTSSAADSLPSTVAVGTAMARSIFEIIARLTPDRSASASNVRPRSRRSRRRFCGSWTSEAFDLARSIKATMFGARLPPTAQKELHQTRPPEPSEIGEFPFNEPHEANLHTMVPLRFPSRFSTIVENPPGGAVLQCSAAYIQRAQWPHPLCSSHQPPTGRISSDA